MHTYWCPSVSEALRFKRPNEEGRFWEKNQDDSRDQVWNSKRPVSTVTTAHQLRALLAKKGYTVSLQTIFRCRSILGWTFCGSAYCQLIRTVNQVSRYNWAVANKDDEFEDVIYTDECSVQLETHKRFCCRKEGQPAKPKPKAKHLVKVHVWAGISKRGATKVCIFEGIMNRWLYIDILEPICSVPFQQWSQGSR